MFKRFTIGFLALNIFLYFSSSQVFANSLTNVADFVTTSRPSAAAPLATNQAAGDTQATISDNGSIFLASDSAQLLADTGETTNIVTVASMSATNIPSSGQRTVYLTSSASNTHHTGDTIVTPITAVHTIQFTAQQPIPNGGKIVLTFPSSGANTASASATTFSFNGLSSSNIVANNVTCSSYTISAPSITCNVGALINNGTTITILIGCSAQSSGTCTTQVPTLINPTKSANAGTADTWGVDITTQNASSATLDTGRAKVGTIESILITATVDVSLNFSITGITNNTAINNGNSTGCTNSETTNTGIDSSATSVNLGTVGNTPTGTNTKINNIAAQLITISTNGANGYSLTATSSGHLINPANGFYIKDSTTPAPFPNGTPWFGLHPCGLDVNTGTWGAVNCRTYITGSSGNLCNYGWPTQTASASIASDSTGPIGNSLTAGNGLISVEYAAGIDASVPAGTYSTVVTYVATPTF